MKQGTIKKALRNFGLTEKESELYIFLGKRGPINSSIIAKQLKMNRGQVYRILKSLQKKDLIEATLEYPTRFTTVPFEKIIDSLIESKQQEVLQIEEAKKDLLSDWKQISQSELESSIEKFAVIEGNKKINQKMAQMVKDAASQILVTLTVSDLCKAEQFGIFDPFFNNPKKSNIHFRILTQPVKQSFIAIKLLQSKFKTAIDFRGLDPSLGSPNFSRMVIRDNDEVILFISDKTKKSLITGNEICLSTNCKSIVKAFSGIFENYWKDSKDIKEWIIQIESKKSPTKTQIIKNPTTARKTYTKALTSAKEEVLLITSAKGLIRISESIPQLKEWSNKGLIVRIMAPITNENLGITQKLLKHSEIRHIPLGYFETTIIDRRHLFRFENTSQTTGISDRELNFHKMFYTNNFDYIKKTTELLIDIWKKTRTISLQSARSIIESRKPTKGLTDVSVHPSLDNTKLIINKKYFHKGKLTEKDVLDRISEEKNISKNQHAHWYETIRLFGRRAFAVIRPPEYFKIPDIVIGVLQNSNESSFGSENTLILMAWLETSNVSSYVPIAVVQDSFDPQSLASLKANLVNTPAAENITVLKKNELQIQVRGKTLFAGWTKSLPLASLNNSLPPCCIIFEGYGEVKPGTFTSYFPSGRKHEVWYLTYDAFVSFYHPKENFIGSGTDGFFDIDACQIMYPIKH